MSQDDPGPREEQQPREATDGSDPKQHPPDGYLWRPAAPPEWPGANAGRGSAPPSGFVAPENSGVSPADGPPGRYGPAGYGPPGSYGPPDSYPQTPGPPARVETRHGTWRIVVGALLFLIMLSRAANGPLPAFGSVAEGVGYSVFSLGILAVAVLLIVSGVRINSRRAVARRQRPPQPPYPPSPPGSGPGPGQGQGSAV